MSDKKVKTIDMNSKKKKLVKNPSSYSKDGNNKKNSLYFSSEEQIIKEMDDPNNEMLKDSLATIISINHNLTSLNKEYNDLKEKMALTEKEVDEILKKTSIKYNTVYKYIPYLKGLDTLVDDYLTKINDKHDSPVVVEQNELYEQLYNCLGHDSYTKILKVFEYYCLFGKSYSNYTMEYSQFCSLFVQNNLYESTLPKSELEVIYNRIKKNTTNKNVTFTEFLQIFNEMSKHLYAWEDKEILRIKHLINNHFSNLPCLAKTTQEKKNERWYFLLESDDIRSVVKDYLNFLYDWFSKNSSSNFRVDMETFIKMAQLKKMVPVFLYNKEVVSTFNFVKYQKKNLYSKNTFDFRLFVESVCLLSLQACEKYLEEGGEINQQNPDEELTKSQRNKNITPAEKLRIFLNFISQK